MSQQSSQASGQGLSLPGILGKFPLRRQASQPDSADSSGVPGWTNGDYIPRDEPLAAWYDETDDLHVQDQIHIARLINRPGHAPRVSLSRCRCSAAVNLPASTSATPIPPACTCLGFPVTPASGAASRTSAASGLACSCILLLAGPLGMHCTAFAPHCLACQAILPAAMSMWHAC